MKRYFRCIPAWTILLLATSLCAKDLIIEDFDGPGMNNNKLQMSVFTFGSAAQAGKPIFAEGLGIDGSNAACFNLTWATGNNANLSFIELSSNVQDLSDYTKIKAFVYLEVGVNSLRNPRRPTKVKLAIEGGPDNTIWQTRTIQAERPQVDVYDELEFSLSSSQMTRVKGISPLSETLSSIKSVRLRFENAKEPGIIQDAYIDSIVATKDKKSGRSGLFGR